MKNKVRFFPLILNIANQIAEPSFIHVVLVTLHSFTTPEELMDLLMIRYANFNGLCSCHILRAHPSRCQFIPRNL